MRLTAWGCAGIAVTGLVTAIGLRASSIDGDIPVYSQTLADMNERLRTWISRA
jgi:hypothetical protein